MDEHAWLQDRARRLCTRREAELAPAPMSRLEREHGRSAALELRREVSVQLAGECFRAGLFAEAAAWFRRRLKATRELADHLARSGDEEGAAREIEELARHAWAVGDLPFFSTYVREGCDPKRGLEVRLEVLPALFLSWAVVGRRFEEAHWRARLAECVEAESVLLAARWAEPRLGAARGLLIDPRRALSAFWLGEFEEAGRLANRSLAAFRSRGRSRPEGLALPHARAWRLRMEGLSELVAGRSDPARLARAETAFAKGLGATVLTHDVDWKDLVILDLAARAWADPAAPLVAEFESAFPHLAPLLARERSWHGEQAERGSA